MKALIVLLLVGLAMPALAEAKKTPKIATDNQAIDKGMKESKSTAAPSQTQGYQKMLNKESREDRKQQR